MEDNSRGNLQIPWEAMQSWLERRLGLTRRLSLPIVLAIGLGLILIFAGSMTKVSNPPEKPRSAQKEERALSRDEAMWTETQWERELAATLSKIRGVGRVFVDLTVEGTEVRIWQEKEENEIRQTQEGTGRSERQSSNHRDLVLTQSTGGAEAPVLKQMKRPRVVGVVVIAEGADSPAIQEELWRATLVATGADPHRVAVMPGEAVEKEETK